MTGNGKVKPTITPKRGRAAKPTCLCWNCRNGVQHEIDNGRGTDKDKGKGTDKDKGRGDDSDKGKGDDKDKGKGTDSDKGKGDDKGPLPALPTLRGVNTQGR